MGPLERGRPLRPSLRPGRCRLVEPLRVPPRRYGWSPDLPGQPAGAMIPRRPWQRMALLGAISRQGLLIGGVIPTEGLARAAFVLNSVTERHRPGGGQA